MLESLFNKVAGLQSCNFIKKRFQRRCFPVKLANFLRTVNLKNIYEWQLQDFTIDYPFNSKCGKRILSLNLLLTKLRNALAPKSLDKLMRLISLGPHIDDLDGVK